ncbi:hypothetical protein ACU6U9_10550 [Pseudomonas sp. HK3]
MSNLKKEINSVDWSSFDGPSSYDAKVMPYVLNALMELDSAERAEDVGHQLIYAIGNDHAGTYYPVVLKAFDYIIAIGNDTKNKACKTCALAILNDMYYFEPDMSGYDSCTADELKIFVKNKLKPYSDESIKF